MSCPFDPRRVLGFSLGAYHCPVCGEEQTVGEAHRPPENEDEDDDEV